MVVLFVTDYIDHFIDWEIVKTKFGCTYVLCHIYGSTVGTEQQFLVQSVFGQVGPDRTVFAAVEDAFFKSFHHFAFSFQIGL